MSDSAKQPFAEQIAAIEARTRRLIPTERWSDLMRSGHDRGFAVAGVMRADLLGDFASIIEQVGREGKSINWFREHFDELVGRYGWDYRGERNWRSRIIYGTNLRSSYAAGRLAQLRDPELAKVAPYWMYRHGGSSDPRLPHLAWDRLVLWRGDPWFDIHYPPNGWGCSCYVSAMSEAQARRRGGRFQTPPPDAPGAVDEGWDYMPGATVADELSTLLAQKAASAPPLLAQALTAATADREARHALFDSQKSFTGQRPGLFDVPPVTVTELRGDEVGGKLSHPEFMLAATEHLRRLQGKTLYNDDTGWALAVEGRMKGGKGVPSDDALRAVAAIDSLIRRAVAVERYSDPGSSDMTFVSFFSAVMIGGKSYRVKITAKEYADGRRSFHDMEIEGAMTTIGRTISIAELMIGATLTSGDPYRP